jgi:threonine aldolase
MACGSAEVLKEAHRLRKRLGGGMRQAGVLAAAARVALETGVERLAEDHANARLLAEGLKEVHEEAVDLAAVETNMVYLNLKPFGLTGAELSSRLREKGILTLGLAANAMRLVTHRDVTRPQVETALGELRRALQEA